MSKVIDERPKSLSERHEGFNLKRGGFSYYDEVWEFRLTSSLPPDKKPEKGKIYFEKLSKEKNKIGYILLSPEGKVTKGKLSIPVEGDLTEEFLYRKKSDILKKTSARGHTPKKSMPEKDRKGEQDFFISYLKKEFNKENFDFIDRLREINNKILSGEYNGKKGSLALQADLDELYEGYVGPKATKEINISGPEREALSNKKSEGKKFEISDFSPVLKTIGQTIRDDTMLRFVPALEKWKKDNAPEPPKPWYSRIAAMFQKLITRSSSEPSSPKTPQTPKTAVEKPKGSEVPKASQGERLGEQLASAQRQIESGRKNSSPDDVPPVSVAPGLSPAKLAVQPQPAPPVAAPAPGSFGSRPGLGVPPIASSPPSAGGQSPPSSPDPEASGSRPGRGKGPGR